MNQVMNKDKGKSTPRPNGIPQQKFRNKVQKVKRYRCGGIHRQEDCRYKNQRCFSCGKMGYVSEMCRTNARKPVLDNRMHLVNDAQPSSITDVTELYSSYKVTTLSNPSESPITMEMNIGGTSLEMELDTGATFSLISKVIYNQLWAKQPYPLKPSQLKLHTYTGEPLKACGEVTVVDLFATLAGGVMFSKLDMAHAYQQILIDDDSKQYLTINTHRGLFVYNRLTFGVSSAPAIF